MRIKKLLSNTILIIIVIAFLITVSIADKNSIIEQLNSQIESKYGIKNYFLEKFGNVGEFNEDIFNKYQIPVYGKPHGKTAVVDGVKVPRLIGYADNGESVPNPDYPPDSVTGQRRVDLSWIENPWRDSRVNNHSNFTEHIKTVTESSMLIEEKTVEPLNDSTTAYTRLKSNPNSAISIEFTSRERYAFTTCCYFNLTIMQVAL